MATCKIIVAAHKAFPMPKDDLYLPVFVGAAGKSDIGFVRDDSGENISELNPNFCELTGLYWAWKNLDADYIGLAHYRRHFSMKKKRGLDYVLTENEIAPYLGKIKVFAPGKRWYYIETLYSHYAHTYCPEHLDAAREILKNFSPQYVDSYDRGVKRRWGYMFNMMILQKTMLDDYCAWLFPILLELKKQIGTDGMTGFVARYPGRISEILFNVWLDEKVSSGALKKDEIMEIPWVYQEKENWWIKGTTFLKAKFLGKKYEKSF